jgi:3-oxoacyl-[acyl-carrier-protein] synthase II
LRSLAARLAGHLTDVLPADEPLGDVAYTLAVGRRRLAYRAALVSRDTADAVAQLVALADGESVETSPSAPAELRVSAAGWLDGVEVPVRPGRRIPLPGYPFQRTRHWIEALR